METKCNSIGKDYNLTRNIDTFITEQLLGYFVPNKNEGDLDIV